MTTAARTSVMSRRGAVALALLGAASLTGCSLSLGEEKKDSGASGGEGENAPQEDGQEPSDGSGPQDGTEPAASDGGGDEDTVIDEETQAAGVNPADLGEPVFTAEIPAVVDGDPEATMTVSLYGLRRSGETLIATFSFLVNSSAKDVESSWLWDYLGGQGWNPFAVDTVNLNRHGVMKSDQNQYTQTEYQGTEFLPGQTFYAFAMFAAPPKDVTTMDVNLVDGAPMATDVEITS